jgi:hypothetical protein
MPSILGSLAVNMKGKGWRVGEIHHQAKLTDNDIGLIFELRDNYKLTYQNIAEKFEVSKQCIFLICNGLRRARMKGRITH